MVRRHSSQTARKASLILRSMVRSLLRNRFLASCWVIDEPPWRTPPAWALVTSARGAGDVDAEMVVEATVLGRERRLDQHVRKVFQRDRIIVLDAAAADRVAVAVKEGDGEVGLLQPIFVGGLAEGGDGEREQQDHAAEADRCGLRQRFDEHPALPPPDIEAVHEGRVALIEFADALARGEQRGVDARIEVQEEIPDPGLPMRWYDLAHLEPSRLGSKAFKHPAGAASRRLAGMLRQTQGARFASEGTCRSF